MSHRNHHSPAAQPRLARTVAAIFVASAGLCMAGATRAAELDSIDTLSQAEFGRLTRDLGAATAYRMLAPAAPLGLTGFDIALVSPFVSLEHREVWIKAAGGADVPSTVPVPSLRIAKGLPLGIDIGAMLSTVPGASAQLAGFELRWAVLEGTPLTPALGLRLATTRLSGVDQLSLSTTSFDVAVSQGFAIVTPYAGAGTVRTSAKADVAGLSRESVSQTRLFGGVHLNLGVFDLTFEGDKTGDTSSVSARVGFRF